MSTPVIHHLSCGTLCPRGARLITGKGGLRERARIVCHCLLIEDAKGLVLIDTGFGTEDVHKPRQLGLAFNLLLSPRLRLAETAASQIQQLGFQPSDVRHIIATHLDLDHAGGLPDFPGAEVHLLSAELRAAMRPSMHDRTRYVAAHWAHGPRWVEHQTGGEQWFGFEGVRVLPGGDTEILLVPLLGHTHGHTGVAINKGERWLLHCGDAFFNHGEVASPPSCPPGIGAFAAFDQVDGAARRGNVERLRELSQRHGEQVQLICSHDPLYLDAAAHSQASGSLASRSREIR